MIGRGNRSTRRKPAPVPLCPPQTPHAALTRTRAAAVGSQRLTAELRHGYGMAYTAEASIHSYIVLQLFVGPWPLLQFRNLFYTVGRAPWMSDQPVARPLPTHRTIQTQNKRIHRHPCLSRIRTYDPRVRVSEDSSYLRPRGHREPK
jgi:hypothetical protein